MLTLHECIVALVRARGLSRNAVNDVNRLHSKLSRQLPAEEADRCRAVTDLDSSYSKAIQLAKDERAAALRCIRTLEDLAKREGGSGRYSAGQPDSAGGLDADAASEAEEPAGELLDGGPTGRAGDWPGRALPPSASDIEEEGEEDEDAASSRPGETEDASAVGDEGEEEGDLASELASELADDDSRAGDGDGDDGDEFDDQPEGSEMGENADSAMGDEDEESAMGDEDRDDESSALGDDVNDDENDDVDDDVDDGDSVLGGDAESEAAVEAGEGEEDGAFGEEGEEGDFGGDEEGGEEDAGEEEEARGDGVALDGNY